MNLIRKDGQPLVKVIHMKHADMAEVNITGVCFVSKLKLLLKFCWVLMKAKISMPNGHFIFSMLFNRF